MRLVSFRVEPSGGPSLTQTNGTKIWLHPGAVRSVLADSPRATGPFGPKTRPNDRCADLGSRERWALEVSDE
jgi:hypothetical protein